LLGAAFAALQIGQGAPATIASGTPVDADAVFQPAQLTIVATRSFWPWGGWAGSETVHLHTNDGATVKALPASWASTPSRTSRRP
jgi:hypothetical protein